MEKKKIVNIYLIIFFFNIVNANSQNIFTVYNTVNSNLPTNNLWYVKSTINDTIMISTWGGGFSRFYNNYFDTYNTANSILTTDEITALFNDSFGNTWIGSENGGLYKYYNDSIQEHFTSANSGLTSNIVYAIEQDYIGRYLFGTKQGSVSILDTNNTWLVLPSGGPSINAYIYSLGVNLYNEYYIGTGFQGIFKLDSNDVWTNWTINNSTLQSNDIYALLIDQSNNVWIGSYGGLDVISGVTGSWTHYDTGNSGLPANYIRQLKIDQTGLLWIATVGGGLASFDGITWTIYNTLNSNLPDNDIFSIEIDDNNILWIATNGGGLAKLDLISTDIEADVLNDPLQISFENLTDETLILTIKTELNINDIYVYDMQGKNISDKILFSMNPNQNRIEVNFCNTSNGMYLLGLSTNKGSWNTKFVKCIKNK